MGRRSNRQAVDLGTISGPLPPIGRGEGRRVIPPEPDEDQDPGEGEDWTSADEGAAYAKEILDQLDKRNGVEFAAIRNAVEFEASHMDTVRKLQEDETLRDLSDDVRGWDNRSGYGLASFSSANRTKLVKQCFHLYYRDGIARNIIRAYTYLTVGPGMSVSFTKRQKKAAARWADIAKNNRWERRYRDIITMTYLLGEWFVVRFPLVGKNAVDANTGFVDTDEVANILASKKPSEIRLRYIEPDEVEALVPSKADREAITGYKLGGNLKTDQTLIPQELSVADVTHFANDALGVVARGRSILEPVMRDMSMRRLFMLDRMTLNAIRTRIPMTIKVPGGPKGKASKRDAFETRGLPRPGSVLVLGTNEDISYPALNLSADSANYDYRMIMLAIAAGVSLPEFIVSMDNSQAAYSATMASTSPLVPLIEDKRALFGELFASLIEEVVGARPNITFRELMMEGVLNSVRANSLLYRDRVISRGTYATKVGIRWEGDGGEKEKVDEEDEERAAELDLMAPPEGKPGANQPPSAQQTPGVGNPGGTQPPAGDPRAYKPGSADAAPRSPKQPDAPNVNAEAKVETVNSPGCSIGTQPPMLGELTSTDGPDVWITPEATTKKE